MKDKKNKADMMREERRRQMMKFIEKKKMKILSVQPPEKNPLRENKNVEAPYQKKEEKPKEVEKTYINGSSRRKKRREKLAELAAQKEELRKRSALALQQEREKKIDERRKLKEEEIAAKKEAAERRNEEINRKKLEALKAREEVRLRSEREKKARAELAAEKAAAAKLAKERKKQAGEKESADRDAAAKKIKEAAVKQKEALLEQQNGKSLEKKEELLACLNSIKEKHNLERQQKLLQKQLLLAGRKASVLRRKEEKDRKKEEALKLQKEAAGLKDAKKQEALKAREEIKLRSEQEKKARAELAAEKAAAAKLAKEQKKQAREKVISEKAVAAKAEKEPSPVQAEGVAAVPYTPAQRRKEELLEFIKTRKLLNEQRSEGRKVLKAVAAEKKEKVIPVSVPVPIPVPVKAGVPLSREQQKKVSAQIAGLVNEAGRINNAVTKNKLGSSVQSAQKFISGFRKKTVSAKKPAAMAVRPAKKVAKYREPFHLLPFIRKNAFKFVFLLLLIGWIGEILLLIRGFQDPQERLKSIVGDDLFTDKPSGEKPAAGQAAEPEKLVIEKPERIDIEGKRDPFSPGRLTMDVLDRPSPTKIVLAPRPEVVSILRPAKAVSVIRGEKQMEPERVSEVSKPQTPSYQTILKSTPSAGVSAAPAFTPLEKIQAPEPTPLIMPEKRCDLVYRGRMLVEGVEYLFIEGKQKTYRVTVGDVVEGFRILKKENNKLHLSKDGMLYEINLD